MSIKCACIRDDALDCAQARYGDTDEPCECVCHHQATCNNRGCQEQGVGYTDDGLFLCEDCMFEEMTRCASCP